MRMPTSRLLPLIALGFLGCPHNAQHATSADPVGCWYFERDAAATALNLPWGVQLDGDALTGWPALERRGGARVARTIQAEGAAQHPFGYWMMAGDSIEIGHPGGGGLLLTLDARATAMSGVATALGDAITPNSSARTPRAVRLTRAQCPEYAS